MPDRAAVLVVAASGRALAASARRAGYAPLVVDYFADDDTRDWAEACVRVEDGLTLGFLRETLVAACERLASGGDIHGVVYGSGFEDRPELLAALARRWPLLGNSPEVVSVLKDPSNFAELCAAAGIPHPETRLSRPGEPSGWLAREKGGSGGGHIRFAEDISGSDASPYYQRRVEGRPVSALALADGARIEVVGFSEQWTTAATVRPFRFAGAARPANISTSLERELTAAVARFPFAASLKGLNSFDFLVSREGFWLLEVNPRPGATLDIFESEDTARDSLFALHLAACRGELRPAPRLERAKASGIVHAPGSIASVPKLAWPNWARDRQPAASAVGAGDPFCTIVADGATVVDARRVWAARAASVEASLLSWAAGRANKREASWA